MKNIIQELFGKSPFGPLVEHAKKVHECVEVIRPLMEALVNEDSVEIRKLQDRMPEEGLSAAVLFYSRDVFYYTGTAQPSLPCSPPRCRTQAAARRRPIAAYPAVKMI